MLSLVAFEHSSVPLRKVIEPPCAACPCFLCIHRFFRHFTMLAVPTPSDSAIKTILSSIITGFLADFNPEVRSLSGPVVLASVDAYNRCAAAAATSVCCFHGIAV